MKLRGFTLIELLVAMTIIGLILGVSFANFRDFNTRQDVDSLYRETLSMLRSVQADAAAGKKPVTCLTQLDGYEISFNAVVYPGGSKSTSYSIFALCPAGTEIQVKGPITLTGGRFLLLNRAPTAGFVKIVFKPLQSGTDIPNSLIITAGSDNSSRTLPITIYSTGDIQ